MSPFTVTATVRPDGSLTVDKLPFPPGQRVEVVVRPHSGLLTESRDTMFVELDVSVDFPDPKPPAE